MSKPPISAPRRPDAVTLLGGGPICPRQLQQALTLAPRLVAADGGANMALAQGLVPEAVIGDLDSLTPEARDAFADRLVKVEEQESVDFEKALTRINAPLTLALGFSGGRMDHALAALSVLVRFPERRCLLLGPEDMALALPRRLSLPLAPGTPVSLYPLGEGRVRSTGLVWPTDALTFRADGRIGTSNEATGPVTLEGEGPMLLILPLATLSLVAAALTQPG